MRKLLLNYFFVAFCIALPSLLCSVESSMVSKEPLCTLDIVKKASSDYITRLKRKPWGGVAEKWIEALEKEEKSIYERLTITSDALKESEQKIVFQQEYPTEFEENRLTGAKSLLVKCIQSYIYSQLGIDTSFMHIVIYTNSVNRCRAEQNIVQLGFNILKNVLFSNPEITDLPCGDIAHEVMHVLDVPAQASPQLLRGRMTGDVNVIKWRKFHEKKADVLAALHSFEVVLSLRTRFKPIDDEYNDEVLLERWGRGPRSGGDKHPSHKERYAYLSEIYEQMVQADQAYRPAQLLLIQEQPAAISKRRCSRQGKQKKLAPKKMAWCALSFVGKNSQSNSARDLF